jgi:1,3-beta-glucanosyltransferase GAS1
MLGINVIEVDSPSPDLEHTACMQSLSNAGIYVLVRLFGRQPQAFYKNGSSYPDYESLTGSESLVDKFHEYPNLLGFYLDISGRSVKAIPVAKLWVRHIKGYIQKKRYRSIPVGINFWHQVRRTISKVV